MASGIPNVNKIISSLAATKYTTVASATILMWDYVLTLDQEISRVWSAKRTVGTTIFFFNRYLPPCIFVLDLYSQFIYSPTETFCRNYEIASSLMDLVSIAIIEAVLVLRTHALYQKRWLANALGILCFCSILNMVTIFFIVIRYETFVSASSLGLRGCLSGCTSKICQPLLIGFWVPFLLLETIVFVLTGWRSYQSLSISSLCPRSSRSSIVTILSRDGLIYYIVIMSVSICNFLMWILDPFASYMAVGLLKGLQATICSRLLLNIRGILETPPQSHVDVELTTLMQRESI